MVWYWDVMFKYQDIPRRWGVADGSIILDMSCKLHGITWFSTLKLDAINQFIHLINFLSIFDSKISLNFLSSSISRILRNVCMDEEELRDNDADGAGAWRRQAESAVEQHIRDADTADAAAHMSPPACQPPNSTQSSHHHHRHNHRHACSYP